MLTECLLVDSLWRPWRCACCVDSITVYRMVGGCRLGFRKPFTCVWCTQYHTWAPCLSNPYLGTAPLFSSLPEVPFCSLSLSLLSLDYHPGSVLSCFSPLCILNNYSSPFCQVSDVYPEPIEYSTTVCIRSLARLLKRRKKKKDRGNISKFEWNWKTQQDDLQCSKETFLHGKTHHVQETSKTFVRDSSRHFAGSKPKVSATSLVKFLVWYADLHAQLWAQPLIKKKKSISKVPLGRENLRRQPNTHAPDCLSDSQTRAISILQKKNILQVKIFVFFSFYYIKTFQMVFFFFIYIQPGAVKLVRWHHWMHETQVHSVTSKNQFHCTRLHFPDDQETIRKTDWKVCDDRERKLGMEFILVLFFPIIRNLPN